MAYLSNCLARQGINSETITPGTCVRIAPNGPRMSSDAFGLGSKVSNWLGPPLSQMKMHDLCVGEGNSAPAATAPGASNPTAPAPAARRTARRLMPLEVKAEYVDRGSFIKAQCIPNAKGNAICR